jgi:hypothetical protein
MSAVGVAVETLPDNYTAIMVPVAAGRIREEMKLV